MSDIYQITVEQPAFPVFVVEQVTDVSVTANTQVETESTVWSTQVANTTWPVYAEQVVYQLTPTEMIATGGSGSDWIHVGPTPPENPEIGDLWLDTN